MTPFDFLNEINQGKKDLMADDIDQQVEKQYNPFIFNYKFVFIFIFSCIHHYPYINVFSISL